MQSPALRYLQDVLGIKSFLQTVKSEPAQLYFVISHELTNEEQALVSKMMQALGVRYQLLPAQKFSSQTGAFLLWGEAARQHFAASGQENSWTSIGANRFFLGTELKNLLGQSTEVNNRKKQIWTELQWLKKSYC